MKMLVTLILAGSILCVAVVIGAVNRSDAVKVGGRTTLIGVAEALAAEELTIESGGQRVRIAKRAENFWMFAEPSQDLVDPHAMRNLLSKIGNLTILETLTKKELKRPEMSLNKLGLDKDNEVVVKLAVRDKSNKITERAFSIGNVAPRADSVYIRDGANKDSPISVVDGNVLPILVRPFANLRERRLVTLPPSALVQVVVKSSETEFMLQRNITAEKTTPWQISKPVLARADQLIVGAMLDDVLNLQLTGGVATGSIDIPEEIPEGAFLFQFWHLRAEEPMVLYLEPKDDPDSAVDVYSAVVTNRPNQVFTHASRIAELLPSSQNDVRDRRLGTIPVGVLDSIGILPNDIILRSKRKENLIDWEVLFNDRFVPADNQKINILLETLGQPIITEFIDGGDPKDYNMGMMRLGLNFKIPPSKNPNSNAGKPEEITKTLEFGFTTDENDRRKMFGSYVNETQIFEIDEGFSALIPLEVVKWRSPRVTQFTHIHIVSIERKISDSIRGGESLNISFDASQGIRGVDGNDKAVPLDAGSATQLRKQLAALKANEWVNSAFEALKLLEQPDAIFVLNVKEQDVATGAIITKGYELKFVEGPNGGVFGQFNGARDVFTITPSFFRKLIQPLNPNIY